MFQYYPVHNNDFRTIKSNVNREFFELTFQMRGAVNMVHIE